MSEPSSAGPSAERSADEKGGGGAWRWLRWLLILAPLWLYLAYLPRFGELQNNDYYSILWNVLEDERFTRDPLRWLTVKSNEHRSTFPALIYAANARLFAGSNRTLSLLALGLMGVVFAAAWRFLPAALRRDDPAGLGLGLGIAAFAFTPVAAHNVAMGFSGTQWLLANALSAVMIGLLVGRGPQQPAWRLYPLTLLGLVGALSYSTSLTVWPALLAGALYLGRGRRQLAWLAASGVGIFLVYYAKFRFLSYHPEPNTRDYGTLGRYLATYMGSLFSREPETAARWGWLGLGAWLVLLALTLAFRRRLERAAFAPWMMLQLYGLASGLGTAVGRSGKGVEQALASRYATLPALVWIGIFVTTALLILRGGPRPRGRARVVALLLLLAGGAYSLHAMHDRGTQVLDAFASRASRQPVAALALVRGYPDEEIITRTLTQQAKWIRAVEPFLRRIGHVPFDREIPRLDTARVDPARLATVPKGEILGVFQGITPLPESPISRIQGWAHHPEKAVAEILLLDPEGRSRAELVTGIHRGAVGKELGRAALASGFEGYASLDWTSEPAEVYVRLGGEEIYYPLRRTKPLQRWLEERHPRPEP